VRPQYIVNDANAAINLRRKQHWIFYGRTWNCQEYH